MTASDHKQNWPTPGDKLFLELKSETSFHIPALNLITQPHAMAFVHAADTIIKAHLSGINRRGYDDHLFLPVVFLYRHAMEIELKTAIKLALDADLFSSQTVNKLESKNGPLSKHELLPLWKCLREAVEEIDDGTLRGPTEAFESMIKELHNVDKDGQTLRYKHDKKGTNNIDKLANLPKLIDVSNLKNGIDKMLVFISSIVYTTAK